jgi:hypothetical protein
MAPICSEPSKNPVVQHSVKASDDQEQVGVKLLEEITSL